MAQLKFNASIFLLCLLVYIFELAVVPAYCQPEPKKESQCNRSQTSNCSGKASNSSCPKPAEEKCNTTDCCLNCPLCYLMLVPATTMPGEISSPAKKMYNHYSPSYFFIYYAGIWKPPNGC